jgi:hypothetical protein
MGIAQLLSIKHLTWLSFTHSKLKHKGKEIDQLVLKWKNDLCRYKYPVLGRDHSHLKPTPILAEFSETDII